MLTRFFAKAKFECANFFEKTSTWVVLRVTIHYIIMSEGYKNVIMTGLEWLVLPFVLLELEIASFGS